MSAEDNRSYAVFLIKGQSIDPSTITGVLGIPPTYSFKKGESFGPNLDRTRQTGLWLLSTAKLDTNPRDIASHLNWILEKLQPHQQQISAIISQESAISELTMVFNLFTHEWGDFLDPKLIQRLAELNIGLAVSFYYLEDLDEWLQKDGNEHVQS